MLRQLEKEKEDVNAIADAETRITDMTNKIEVKAVDFG